MAKKQMVILMRLMPGKVSIDGEGEHQIELPPGCKGIMMVFESKKAAREYCGKKDVNLLSIEEGKGK